MHFTPALLHIPDGFLSWMVSLVSWAITILLIWIAVRRSQQDLDQRQIPLMGIMAAFIFAAQMINFPVAGGTSGHLLGGTLAAIVLGPWAGMLVMTSVIAMQKEQLQQHIRTGIPISEHMDFRVLELSPTAITVCGGGAENINVHGTAFAGALY